MAEDEESSQKSIKFYLEAFSPYIYECVRAKDLLIHIQFYSDAERKEISLLSKNQPTEATKLAVQKLLKKDEPGLYRAFKEAMGPKQAGNPKVFQILSGKFIPTEEEDHYKRIIQLFMDELLGRIPVIDIVPHLYREDVISLSEKEEIECELRNSGRSEASWVLLLFYLPQRVERWFRVFLKALIECGQKDLAEKLDPDLCTKIIAQTEEPCRVEDTKVSEREEDTLKLLPKAGEDQEVLVSVQEKDDQEKSKNESVVGEGKLLLSNGDPSENKNESDDIGFDSDETSLKSPIGFRIIQMQELKENAILKTDLEENSVSLSFDTAKESCTTDMQGDYVELSNLDTASTEKPNYMKAVQAIEPCHLLNEEEKSKNESVLGEGEVSSDEDDPCGNENEPDDTGFGTDETNLKSPIDFNTIQMKELKENDILKTDSEDSLVPLVTDTAKNSCSTDMQRAYVELSNLDTASAEKQSYVKTLQATDPCHLLNEEEETAEKSATALHSKNTNYDLLKEDKRRRENHDDTVPGRSDAELIKLISSLEHCNVASSAVNDLSKIKVEPPSSIEFYNIENETEIEINLRSYQNELAENGCQGENAIILAPANSGKTWVACRIIQEHFRRYKGPRISKCALVVKNAELAQQQGECCANLLQHLRMKVFSEETQIYKRELLKDFVDRKDILVVTAKVLHNALKQKEIDSITKFSLIVFDECHQTQSDHHYHEIMHFYHELKATYGSGSEALPQVIGLTTSLGVGNEVTLEKAVKQMESLMANLDVKTLCRVKRNCEELERYMNTPVKGIIIVPRRANGSFRTRLTEVMKAIERLISRTREHLDVMPTDLDLVNRIMKTVPEEKGSEPYAQWLRYLKKGLAKLSSKSRLLTACRLHLKNYNDALLLYGDARVEDAMLLLEERIEQLRHPDNIECEPERIMFQMYDRLKVLDFTDCSLNPKLKKLQEILLDELGQNGDARGIIFVKTRMLAQYLIRWMKATDIFRPLNPAKFVRQTVQDRGVTEHEQKDAFVCFKDGKHKLIAATSVAEEELDITKCNVVIGYEYITKEIARTPLKGRERAPSSRYYVVTEEKSAIAFHKEKTALSDTRMNEAVIALENKIDTNRNSFEINQSKLQSEASLKRDMKKKRKEERLRDDEFKFHCFHCGKFICTSSDIKKIQGADRICTVCISADVNERVSFHRRPLPQFKNGDVKIDGDTSCDICQHSLGDVYEYKGIEFPLLKVHNFRLVDRNGKRSRHKRWRKVHRWIQEINTADLLKFACINSDSD